MKPLKSFAFSAMALSLLMATGTVSAEKSPGKYCDTPSRCINPITKYGAVTSPNYLASVAGLEVLQKGGNAVDAAIAVASTRKLSYFSVSVSGLMCRMIWVPTVSFWAGVIS